MQVNVSLMNHPFINIRFSLNILICADVGEKRESI
jgi:hypothetical protein